MFFHHFLLNIYFLFYFFLYIVIKSMFIIIYCLKVLKKIHACQIYRLSLNNQPDSRFLDFSDFLQINLNFFLKQHVYISHLFSCIRFSSVREIVKMFYVIFFPNRFLIGRQHYFECVTFIRFKGKESLIVHRPVCNYLIVLIGGRLLSRMRSENRTEMKRQHSRHNVSA